MRLRHLEVCLVHIKRPVDLDVVVEGVDHPAQLQRLHSFGAHVIQGFLFARPMPPDDLASYSKAGEWRGVIDDASLGN